MYVKPMATVCHRPFFGLHAVQNFTLNFFRFDVPLINVGENLHIEHSHFYKSKAPDISRRVATALAYFVWLEDEYPPLRRLPD